MDSLGPVTAAFFPSGAGTRLNHTNISATFTGATRRDVSTEPGTRRLRLYDLRHSFAVAALAR